MATIRELQFAIDTNTKGLDKAIPVLTKLAKSMAGLEKSIAAMAKNFETASQTITKGAVAQSSAISKLGDKSKAALLRQQIALDKSANKMKVLSVETKRIGASGRIIGSVRNSFNALEKTIGKTEVSTIKLRTATFRFDKTMTGAKGKVKEMAAAHAAANAQQKINQQGLIAQKAALVKVKQQYLGLLKALQGTKGAEKNVQILTNSFRKFEAAMKGPVLAADKFKIAANKMASTMAVVKRGGIGGSKGVKTLNDRMVDLSKSVQVALGPLSGVAARLTAMTALANRNNIAIAGLIGGIVALGVAMAKAVRVGAEYEKELLSIEAVLEATGRTSNTSVQEMDVLAKKIGLVTLTTQSAARKATTALATFKNVPKELFESALLAAQGMSLIARGDINSQIRKLGRVFDDPINNLNTLTEAGIQFNAVEKQAISLLQISGNLRGAQAIVEKRLNAIISLSTRQTRGLAGAWDSLTETFTNFSQEASVASGIVEAITEILDDFNKQIKRINDNTKLAIATGTSFRVILQALGAAFSFVMEFAEPLLILFTLLAGHKLFKLVKGLAIGLWKLVSPLKAIVKWFVALKVSMVAFGVVGGVTVGAMLIVFAKLVAILLIVLSLGFALFRVFDNVFKLFRGEETNFSGVFDDTIGAGKKLLQLGRDLIRNPLTLVFAQDVRDPEIVKSITKVEKALTNKRLDILVSAGLDRNQIKDTIGEIRRQIVESNVNKIPITFDRGLLASIGDELSAGNIMNAATLLETMRVQIDKIKKAMGEFTPAQERALITVTKFKNELLGNIVANDLFINKTKGLTDATELLKDKLAAINKIYSDQGGIVRLTTEQLDIMAKRQLKIGGPLQKLTTQLKNQTILASLQVRISKAVNEERAALVLTQLKYNAALAQGVVVDLSTLENQGKLLPLHQRMKDAIDKQLTAQQKLKRDASENNEITLLNEGLSIRALEISMIGKSAEARKLAVALARKELELSLRLLGVGKEARQAILDAVKATSMFDASDVIEKTLKNLKDQTSIAQKSASLAGMSTNEAALQLSIFRAMLTLKNKIKDADKQSARIASEFTKANAANIQKNHIKRLKALKDESKLIKVQLAFAFDSVEAQELALELEKKKQQLVNAGLVSTESRFKLEVALTKQQILQKQNLEKIKNLGAEIASGLGQALDSLADQIVGLSDSTTSFKETFLNTMREIHKALLDALVLDPIKVFLQAQINLMLQSFTKGGKLPNIVNEIRKLLGLAPLTTTKAINPTVAATQSAAQAITGAVNKTGVETVNAINTLRGSICSCMPGGATNPGSVFPGLNKPDFLSFGPGSVNDQVSFGTSEADEMDLGRILGLQIEDSSIVAAENWNDTFFNASENMKNAITGGSREGAGFFGDIFHSIFGGGGGGGGGGGLLSGLGGSFVDSFLGDAVFDFADVFLGFTPFHGGGKVGSGGGATRAISAGSITGSLPRFHNGLGSDEILGILQKGEEVTSKDDVSANDRSRRTSGGGGAGFNSLTINFPNADIDSFRANKEAFGADAASFLEDVNRRNN